MQDLIRMYKMKSFTTFFVLTMDEADSKNFVSILIRCKIG